MVEFIPGVPCSRSRRAAYSGSWHSDRRDARSAVSISTPCEFSYWRGLLHGTRRLSCRRVAQRQFVDQGATGDMAGRDKMRRRYHRAADRAGEFAARCEAAALWHQAKVGRAARDRLDVLLPQWVVQDRG